jgi:Ca2+-binding EF-hand superfamily protein
VFRDFDEDRNGLLSNSEILAGLMKLDVEMTQGQAKSLVSFLDQGGDGEIDLMELDICIKVRGWNVVSMV